MDKKILTEDDSQSSADQEKIKSVLNSDVDSEQSLSTEINETAETAQLSAEESESAKADHEVIEENKLAEEKNDEPAADDKSIADEKEKPKTDDEDVEYVVSPYLNNQFLRFGFDSDLDFISPKDTLLYLQNCGFDNNSLSQARERVLESMFLEQIYDPHKENCRYCDFCGAELSGVEYDIIADGRERCNECSRTVLNTIEEFNDAFVEVRRNMEAMFGIRILASIDVKTMDARKLARKLKIKFTPTPGFDGRVLGVAINERGIYRLYVENQSPYLNAVATIAHELTHIWQYVNWNRKVILKKYGRKMEKCIYEGMAKWVEIQYLYFINEPDRAYRELCATLMRDDEYGIGLKLYLNEYDLSKGVNIDIKTPFYDLDIPLHDV